jgi:hypothetical protein
MLAWAAYSDQWELNHKVTFDGVNKRIYISPNVSNLDVKTDLYSDWKEWFQLYDNAKYLPAFRTIGGDPTGVGQSAGDIYFLINDWQIVISHFVEINGILYHDNPALKPYIIEQGGGVIATVSSLAQSVEGAAAGLTPEQQIQLDKILKAVRVSIALSA